MKISVPVHIVFSLCLCCSPVLASDHSCDTLETMHLLPQIEGVNGLVPAGEVQCAAGENLFLLIDGGADIYHEYGFTEAVFQSYDARDGSSINLEIYKMADPGAAYGMYTFKTGPDGMPVGVGHGGWLESYYVNFWKGNYLVTITGLDPDSTAVDDILAIAGAVNSRLQAAYEPPPATSLLPRNNLKANGITYLRGTIALRNLYYFDTEDIFGLKEGVAGEYDEYTLFVFQYGDQETSNTWYEHAKKHLKQNDRFSDFTDRDACFEMNDHQNRRISIKHSARWIVIVLGAGDSDLPRITAEVEKQLAH